jgi:TnpA family transposase
MARRRILTPAQRLALLALPVDRAEAARYYTLSEAELAAINRRRGGRSRLGFALQLCAFRYPGRLLHPGEELPHAVVAFVAEQIGVAPDTLAATPFAPTPSTSTPRPCRTCSAGGPSKAGRAGRSKAGSTRPA